MNALQNLIPNWLHRGEEYEAMPDDRVEPPPVASMPEPFNEEDENKLIFSKAAVAYEQLKRDRLAAEKREQEMQVQLTEMVLAREGDAKKIDFLELENAELRNDIAALKTDIESYRSFMSSMKKFFDNFGIEAPAKKPRNGKVKPESKPGPMAITPNGLTERPTNEQ
jgi:hypothetical protein